MKYVLYSIAIMIVGMAMTLEVVAQCESYNKFGKLVVEYGEYTQHRIEIDWFRNAIKPGPVRYRRLYGTVGSHAGLDSVSTAGLFDLWSSGMIAEVYEFSDLTIIAGSGDLSWVSSPSRVVDSDQPIMYEIAGYSPSHTELFNDQAIVLPVADRSENVVIMIRGDDTVKIDIRSFKRGATRVKVLPMENGRYRLDYRRMLFADPTFQSMTCIYQYCLGSDCGYVQAPVIYWSDHQVPVFSPVRSEDGTVYHSSQFHDSIYGVIRISDTDTIVVLGVDKVYVLRDTVLLFEVDVKHADSVHGYFGGRPPTDIYVGEDNRLYLTGLHSWVWVVQRGIVWSIRSALPLGPGSAWNWKDSRTWLLADRTSDQILRFVFMDRDESGYMVQGISSLFADSLVKAHMQLGEVALSDWQAESWRDVFANGNVIRSTELYPTGVLMGDTFAVHINDDGLLTQAAIVGGEVTINFNGLLRPCCPILNIYGPIRDLDIDSSGEGVVVGDDGTMFTTTDRGRNWSYVPVSDYLDMRKVLYMEKGKCLVLTPSNQLCWIKW